MAALGLFLLVALGFALICAATLLYMDGAIFLQLSRFIARRKWTNQFVILLSIATGSLWAVDNSLIWKAVIAVLLATPPVRLIYCIQFPMTSKLDTVLLSVIALISTWLLAMLGMMFFR